MKDAEFYARLQVLLNNLMPGIGRLSQVDFGNLNDVTIEIEKRQRQHGIKYDGKVMEYQP